MKSTKLLAIVSAALILGGGGCNKMDKHVPAPANENTAMTNPSTTPAAANPAPVAKAPAKKPTQTAVVAAAMKYEEALEKYRENGLMQFVDCHGTPGTFTYKKGVPFMIDNRDNKTHKIVIQGATYTLGAYGYALVTAKNIGESYVTCDGGGAGTLKIQQ